MQISPALPWAEGEGGLIQFRDPVTINDLLAGVLQIKNGDVALYPNKDGLEVQLIDPSNRQVAASVIFDDDTPTNTIDIEVAAGTTITSISLVPAHNEISDAYAIKSDGTQAAPGDDDCVIMLYAGGNVGILSQDNETAIKVAYDGEKGLICENEGETDVTAGILLDNIEIPSNSPLAHLPLIPGVLVTNGLDEIKLMCNYQPTGVEFYLLTANGTMIRESDHYDRSVYIEISDGV